MIVNWFHRLEFLQYLEDFSNLKKEILSDSALIKIVYKLRRLTSTYNHALEIEFPYMLESLLYNNIIIEYDPALIESEVDKIENYYDFHWEKISIGLLSSSMDSDQCIGKLKADLIIILLKYAFKLVNKYYDPREYGLPSKTWLEHLSSKLVGNMMTFISTPFYTSELSYNEIILTLENEYLKERIKDLGEDPNVELDNRSFQTKKSFLYEALMKSKRYSITLEPKVKADSLREQAYQVLTRANDIQNDILTGGSGDVLSFKRIRDHSERYCFKFFVEKKSFETISWELIREKKIFVDPATVKDNIENLAWATGFKKFYISIIKSDF